MVVGTLTTVYADSRVAKTMSHTLKVHHSLVTAHSTNSKKKSGSAHDGTAAKNTKPNASQPVLAGLQTASCTIFPPKNPYLSQALTPELRKLAQYEQLCNGSLFSRTSFFVETPSTVSDARSSANDIASRLKEYDQFGIKPLVFMEPTSNGSNLDLSQYANGAYDSALDAYYAALKSQGITDGMMGIWVLLPEGNLPEWSSVDPGIYAKVVTRTAQLQKKYFPASQVSLMLDSETYPATGSWDNGSYTSLVPYVQNIPSGLIDSFGVQGFPWAAPSSEGSTYYDPNTYLRLDFAEQAAHSLGIQSLWVNTGTFHQMYANQAGETVTVSPLDRQTMLNGVIKQVNSAKSQGFSVAIHLFAENKASVSEGTDWSYWQLQPSNDADTAVFTTFVHDATASNIPLWLFDTDEH